MAGLTRSLHVLFALLLTWSAVMGIVKEITLGSSVWIAFVCAYWVVIAGMFRNRRIAWLLAIIPPAYVALRIGPMLIINVYMFATGHELYLDSPATIIIVFIYGVVVLLPSLMLVMLTLLNYKWIRNSSHHETQ